MTGGVNIRPKPAFTAPASKKYAVSATLIVWVLVVCVFFFNKRANIDDEEIKTETPVVRQVHPGTFIGDIGANINNQQQARNQQSQMQSVDESESPMQATRAPASMPPSSSGFGTTNHVVPQSQPPPSSSPASSPFEQEIEIKAVPGESKHKGAVSKKAARASTTLSKTPRPPSSSRRAPSPSRSPRPPSSSEPAVFSPSPSNSVLPSVRDSIREMRLAKERLHEETLRMTATAMKEFEIARIANSTSKYPDRFSIVVHASGVARRLETFFEEIVDVVALAEVQNIFVLRPANASELDSFDFTAWKRKLRGKLLVTEVPTALAHERFSAIPGIMTDAVMNIHEDVQIHPDYALMLFRTWRLFPYQLVGIKKTAGGITDLGFEAAFDEYKYIPPESLKEPAAYYFLETDVVFHHKMYLEMYAALEDEALVEFADEHFCQGILLTFIVANYTKLPPVGTEAVLRVATAKSNTEFLRTLCVNEFTSVFGRGFLNGNTYSISAIDFQRSLYFYWRSQQQYERPLEPDFDPQKMRLPKRSRPPKSRKPKILEIPS